MSHSLAIIASRIIILGLFFELVTLRCDAGQAHAMLQRRLLGDGALEMRFPQDWSLRKNVSFESETYTAAKRGAPLFLIYLGNNPAFDSIRHDRVTVGKLHGNFVRNYFLRGLLTDVIVIPNCGRDKYVWLKRISPRRNSYAAIMSAFGTARCAPTIRRKTDDPPA